jgi:hypothetical protein
MPPIIPTLAPRRGDTNIGALQAIAAGPQAASPTSTGKSVADVVKFNWEMVSTDGEVVGVGLEFLVLGPDGQIRRDYQFIES